MPPTVINNSADRGDSCGGHIELLEIMMWESGDSSTCSNYDPGPGMMRLLIEIPMIL